MNRIGEYRAVAKKVSGLGSVSYDLWVDGAGDLFIQIVGNERSGTYTNHAFSVREYGPVRDEERALGSMNARSIKSGELIVVEGNNNGAFLKAALQHLMDGNGGHPT